MEIIQIVGYKNSGKTTLASLLIETLTNQGINVASLKHHGHGGIPSGMEETDSAVHLQAGAVVSGVEGDGVFQLAKQKPWDVEEMLAFYSMMDAEAVVMEGFKKYPYQKIVLIRQEKDLPLLETVTNIKAVVTSLAVDQETYPYPIFQPTELSFLIEWMTTLIRSAKWYK